MNKKKRMCATYLGLTALLLIFSVTGWGSMMPIQLSVKPTVTINQARGQADWTTVPSVHFTVVFSKAVKDFSAGDVTLDGTAPGARVSRVTGSGKTYEVYVTDMTGDGTVIAYLLAGVAHDAVGNASKASTSKDNRVTYYGPLTVTINQAEGQDDPTTIPSIHFTVVFSKVVTDFAAIDVTLGGTAPGSIVTNGSMDFLSSAKKPARPILKKPVPGKSKTPVSRIVVRAVTGSGTTYDVEVIGMTDSGTVIASLVAGVAHDTTPAHNASRASTSTDNTVTYIYDVISPTVTTVNRYNPLGQNTNADFVTWRVTFSEPINASTALLDDFTLTDVFDSITGNSITASGPTSGSTTTIDVTANTGTGNGTLRLDVFPSATISDIAGNDYNSTYVSGQTYIIDTYTLTVIADHGSVTQSPDQVLYDYGDVVTLTAVPDANYHFTGWSGDLSGTTSPATITMDGDKTVTANFDLGPTPDVLASAERFGIFGGSAGMTNMGDDTVINGDIGTTATGTSSITGFHEDPVGDIYTETCPTGGAALGCGKVTGKIYTCTNSTTGPTCAICIAPNTANPVSCGIATVGRADALAAYNALVAMPVSGVVLPANLAGLTVAPGVYSAPGGSFMIQDGLPGPEGDLTLAGTATDVWVFQMATTLTVGGPGAAFPRSVILTGGALAKNVYWQVGTFATINAAGGGTMEGTIISQDGASFGTAPPGPRPIITLNGRAISLGASVTLVNTVVTLPLP